MRPAGGAMKKFGARRRMRFGHNKIVKRKPFKPLRKKGIAKGKSRFRKDKRKKRMKKRLSKKNVIRKSKKMQKTAEVVSKMISKVGVKEEKEIGATFRLGRFGAQFFAPVLRSPPDTESENDDSDGEDVESEHSEDEEVGQTANK